VSFNSVLWVRVIATVRTTDGLAEPYVRLSHSQRTSTLFFHRTCSKSYLEYRCQIKRNPTLAMDYGHLVTEQNDAMYLAWFRILQKKSPEELAATLAAQHRDGKVVRVEYLSRGSFNHCYKVKFEEGPDALVRFAALGKVSFPKRRSTWKFQS
jgi:hypothetical protein